MTAADSQPVTAGIYLRVSKSKDKRILSVKRQEPRCREFCEQQGWVVGEVYKDENRSAWKEGVPRDDFERMLGDVRAGRINGIVSWQMDRLLRTVEDAAAIVALAKQYGTRIGNVGGTIDLNTADGRQRFYDLAVAAEYEGAIRSERSLSKHDELRREGGWQGGQRPFGYRLVGTKVHDPKELDCTRADDDPCPLVKCELVPHPVESGEIRRAAERVLRGGSISGLERDWVERGIHRPNGGLFSGQHIRHMLVSPRLTGRRRGQDPDAPEQWPPILSVDQHLALIKKLGPGRRPVGQREKRGPRKNLLPGFAYCAAPRNGGRCGTRLKGKRSEGRRRYECERRMGGCGGLKCVAEPLEDRIRDSVITALDDPEMGPAIRGQLAARLTDASEEQELNAQIQADKARLNQLADDYADGVFADREQFERANRRVQRRIAEAEERLDAIRERGGILVDLPDGAEALWKAWEAWDIEERRWVINLAVERVWVKPAGQGKRFTVDRVEIDWRV
jgi:site-specific DNA recombinase